MKRILAALAMLAIFCTGAMAGPPNPNAWPTTSGLGLILPPEHGQHWGTQGYNPNFTYIDQVLGGCSSGDLNTLPRIDDNGALVCTGGPGWDGTALAVPEIHMGGVPNGNCQSGSRIYFDPFLWAGLVVADGECGDGISAVATDDGNGNVNGVEYGAYGVFGINTGTAPPLNIFLGGQAGVTVSTGTGPVNINSGKSVVVQAGDDDVSSVALRFGNGTRMLEGFNNDGSVTLRGRGESTRIDLQGGGGEAAMQSNLGDVRISAGVSAAGQRIRLATGNNTRVDISDSVTAVGNTLNALGGVQVNGVAGATCSGAPTGLYATVNGIATHC